MNDPADPRGRRPVVRQEVGPGLYKVKPHAAWVNDLHFANPALDLFGAGAPITLEGEFHVFGGHRIAVVELDAVS